MRDYLKQLGITQRIIVVASPNVQENFNLDTMMQACYARGLMVLKANNNTIRIAPSLIIEDDVIQDGLAILRSAIQEQLQHQL